MDETLDLIGNLLTVVGACFALVAGIGVNRFPDAYSRMHAAAKSPTLGLILAALGAGLRLGTLQAAGTLFLVVVLQMLTSPVGTHVAARAVHLRIKVPQDGIDELQRDEHHDDAVPGGTRADS